VTTPEHTHQDEGALRARQRELARFAAGLRKSGKARPEELLRLADLMQRAGRPEDSLKVLRRLLEQHPRHLVGHFLAARAHELCDRPRAAADQYALLERWAPPWAEPRRRHAACLQRLGRPADARLAMEAYLARAPEDTPRRRALAADYLRAEEPGAALKHLEWIESTGVAEVADHVARGMALEGVGRTGEAAGAYEDARAAGGGPDVALRLARLRLRRGELERCREACDAVLARRVDDAAALSLAAEAALRQGDLDRAQVALDRLHQLRPEDATIRGRLAEVLLAAGDLREARRHLQPLVDKDPRDVRAALRLAEVHRRLQDPRRARDLYGRVLAADPGQPLALLRVGEMALSDGEAKSAIQPLRRLVLRSPANPVAHRMLGEALRRGERPQDARKHLERALELDPADAHAALELGHTLREVQALAGAEVAYQRVLRLAPETDLATRASYELSHLRPKPATKEAPRTGIVVPLRPVDGESGLVAPPAGWKRTA
jgi:tetratricopeptide (TPR) repeat protein